MIHPRRPVRQHDKRRVVDNARRLNNLIDQSSCSVSYEDLRSVPAMCAPFMSKIYLKKGYRQVAVSPSLSPFLPFMWRGRFYSFNVLPFGLRSPPMAFTKVMKAFVLHWRILGIHCIIYLDDILFGASTFDEWLAAWRRILADFRVCRVRLGLAKVFIGPFSKLEFLGVLVDAINRCFSVSPLRVSDLIRVFEMFLIKRQTDRCLSVLGKISFMSVAC